ncbi:MAG TPA: PQQ-dependent sugar dehydrogenase [Myxococcales bacterium]
MKPPASALCAAILIGCHSSGTSPDVGLANVKLALQPFVTAGLDGPVFMTQPLDDGRMFVVEQAGRIRVIRDGALQAAPFLDLTARVLSGGERGLLSVAFHPAYATNHLFYVYFTSQPSGDIRIERFNVTANPEVADPASSQLVLATLHSEFSNHNGGLLSFGPDGFLYAGLGDGGSGGDPHGNGQNPNALLASLLRLDVDHGLPYAIPPGNPFANGNGRPEVWAKGLRNPWRYAFDPPTATLYVADVGQDLHEEVDVVAAGSAGVNYGWNLTEGFSCYNASTCDRTGLQAPVLDYPHDGRACSITGGYVYRGVQIPALTGHYFYSDFCAGFVRSFRFDGAAAAEQHDWGLTAASATSFAVDRAGELYLIAGNSILKLVEQ